MFSDFYRMKSHENAINSATAEAREKVKTNFESCPDCPVYWAYLSVMTKLIVVNITPGVKS
jgi:hypothetical protein